jgi:ABC-type multidrug transport system fused ATPase/permease subunit
VLEDLSFTLPAGQVLCIVGKTGVGKSTVLSLLVRLHDPGSGAVRMGGVDVRDMAVADVRGGWLSCRTLTPRKHPKSTDRRSVRRRP